MKHFIFVCYALSVAVFMFGRVLSVCERLCASVYPFCPGVDIFWMIFPQLKKKESNDFRLNQSVSLHPAFKFKSSFIGTVGTRHHLHLISAICHVSPRCHSIFLTQPNPPNSLY